MITREELYELVWSKPMIRLAEQFDVSGSYMARVCSRLNVPRPMRGYWAKLAVQKTPPRLPLPNARPGDQVAWSRDGELGPSPKPQCEPRRRRARVAVPKNEIHGLLIGAKEHFESGRDKEGYLKPAKQLLVDVTASRACLEKALAFANVLFNALESFGHRVMLSPPHELLRRAEIEEREHLRTRRDYYYSRIWSPKRPTVAYFGTVTIGLAIVEMSEEVLLRYVNGEYIRDSEYKPQKSRYFVDHSWTTTRSLPSNRIRLIAYSPYHRVDWSIHWEEKKDALATAVPRIVKALEQAAVDLVPKLEEAERLAELQRLRWIEAEEKRRRDEDARLIEQSFRESDQDLRQILEEWSRVMNVESFLARVEARAATESDERRAAVIQRLKLAREFLGSQDPLDHFLGWLTPAERYEPKYP